MKALITGVSGFVGRYLAQNLLKNGYEVWGGTRKFSAPFIDGIRIIELTLDNVQNLKMQLNTVKPDIVFHLAGQSSVKDSWSHIYETFHSNVSLSLNLLEAIRIYDAENKVKVITVGSSEEYGLVNSKPIEETSETNPGNPYGSSKLTLGKAAMYYAQNYNMDIIHARPFNHIGPGQKLGFVTSDFAKQVTDLEKQNEISEIFVGNLDSKRDFTDVRDIVNAYRLLAERGHSKEIYNVCSNVSTSIKEILNTFVGFSEKEIKVSVDKSKFRPIDIPDYYGSNQKLRNHTGWYPTINLEQSLLDIYEYWKGKETCK